MGEYANFRGRDIKIGTCENMYYVRADQRHLISGYTFADIDRFRFPFPDEDENEPGHFEDYDRGSEIPGWQLPEEWAEGHGSVQFTSSAGYVLSVPCPEAFSARGLKAETRIGSETLRVGRNGFRGYPQVKYQRAHEGILKTIVGCGACGALWRLDSLEDALPVIEAYRSAAERREEEYRLTDDWSKGRSAENLRTIADRIEAGYAGDPYLTHA